VPVVAEPVTWKDRRASISKAQKKYINDLHGHWEVDWSYNRASKEISDLLGSQPDRKKKTVDDPRLTMIEGMMDLVPDGFYAAQADVGGHVDFLKVKRPTSGRFKDTIKISTQHSEVWRERIVKWPSGQWSIYDNAVIDMLMLVIADHKTCARRYAIELQRCCCCGKELTDDRSRHYLIGPVCDKKEAWSIEIERVDDLNDGLTYEQLVARGLPTRVWQERFLNAS